MTKYFALISSILLLFACSPKEKGKAIVLATETPEASGQTESGKQTVNGMPKPMQHCKPCHTLGRGEKSRIGPNLCGIVGKKVGQSKGFTYSKAFAEGNWTWTRENIRLIISRTTGAATETVKQLSGDPSAKTNMKFYGASDDDAQIILDYLETLK